MNNKIVISNLFLIVFALLITCDLFKYGIAEEIADEFIGPPLTSEVVQDVKSEATTDVKIEEKNDHTIPLVDAIQKTQPQVKLTVTFGKIFWSIVIFLIGWLLVRFFTKILETLAERWTNLRLTVKGIIPMFRIGTLIFTTYLVIAWIINPPMQTLLAVTASAGIAIGFASQDVLKNIFGGIMILFDRPFQVGDKIQVGNHYGEVISIGLRTVRITTPDDSMVSIPNSEIVNQSVSNSNSGESNCQVVAEIYLPVNIDTNLVRDLALKSAAVSRYVYLKKPIVVVFRNEMHQYRPMLKMRIKAYVFDIRYEFNFLSDMTETTIKILLERGIVTPEDVSEYRTNVPRDMLASS